MILSAVLHQLCTATVTEVRILSSRICLFPKTGGNEGSPLYQYATFVVENVDEYETVKERIQAVDIGWERYDFLDNTGMSDTMTENFGELERMSSLILILVCIELV